MGITLELPIYMPRVVNYVIHDNRQMMIVTSNCNVYGTGHRSLNKFNKLKEKKFQKIGSINIHKSVDSFQNLFQHQEFCSWSSNTLAV
jgi:hypothetical protein